MIKNVAVQETASAIHENGMSSLHHTRAIASGQLCVVAVFLKYFVNATVLCVSCPKYCYGEMES